VTSSALSSAHRNTFFYLPDLFEASRLEAQLHRLDSVKLIAYMQDHFIAATAWNDRFMAVTRRNITASLMPSAWNARFISCQKFRIQPEANIRDGTVKLTELRV